MYTIHIITDDLLPIKASSSWPGGIVAVSSFHLHRHIFSTFPGNGSAYQIHASHYNASIQSESLELNAHYLKCYIISLSCSHDHRHIYSPYNVDKTNRHQELISLVGKDT